jgi:FkbM family methyltransferase
MGFSPIDALVTILRPFQFRGKLRLLGSLVPRRGDREAKIFGVRVALDLADDMQRWIYLGVFEPKETRQAWRLLGPGMTVVDVGANIGYFTLLAAARTGPTGRVIAVEPSPYAHQRLAETIRRNGLTQVRVEPIALGDQAGEFDLYIPPEEARNHSPTLVPAPGMTTVRVPVHTLDDRLDEWGIDRVDLLKLDVQGFEPHVCRGAVRAFREGRIRALMCEIDDYWLREVGSSPKEFYDALLDLGFVDTEPPPRFEKGRLYNRCLTAVR